jgi:hypothetical protein
MINKLHTLINKNLTKLFEIRFAGGDGRHDEKKTKNEIEKTKINKNC